MNANTLELVLEETTHAFKLILVNSVKVSIHEAKDLLFLHFFCACQHVIFQDDKVIVYIFNIISTSV